MSALTATSKQGRTHKDSSFVRVAKQRSALIPSMLVFAVFLLGPILYSFYGSLTNAELSGVRAVHPEFIGLDNYEQLFADPKFWSSLLLTVIFVVASALVGQNILGLLLALLMEKASKPIKFLATVSVVTAWVLPEIVAAFACYAFFADHGTINAILASVGLSEVSWLFKHPVLAITFANIWRGTAFSMLIYSAALGEVPPEVVEASTVDGASEFQKVWFVKLPIIRRSIFTNMMLVTLQTMGVFTIIWVMTAGGPSGASTTLPILAYERAFKMQLIGMGTAISTALLLLGALMSIVYIRLLKKGE